MSTLINTLKRHEGLRLKPYRCSANKLTIGYGRNLEDVGISEREAEAMLLADMLRSRADLFKVFPDADTFSQGRQDALINMVFNLGLTRFLGFKKMIAAIEDRDWERAADEAMDSRWYHQVKSRGEEVVSLIREG